MSYFKKISYSDSPSLDAFGRLRTSQITTQIDLKQLDDGLPLFIDKVLNGDATALHSEENACTNLVTTTSGDYAIAQTFQRFSYQTGKSQQIFMTFANFEPQANVTKRIGYYSSSEVAPHTDNFDGLFLESSEGTIYCCIYKSGVLTSKVARANWSIDKFDGTGLSGLNIDFDKTQILQIDFEWLGVGRVRWCLVVDGIIYEFHHSNHANFEDEVYMSRPNQPLRWELRQSGAGSGEFKYICSTVGSEGSLNELGKIISVNDNIVPISPSITSTYYAGLGIRLKADALGSFIDIVSFNLFNNSANAPIMWELRLNPTVAGTFTYGAVANSAMEFAVGVLANTVTGGTILDSGYVVQRTADRFDLKNALRLGASIAGTRDTLVLLVRAVSGSPEIYRSITWREQI